MYAVLGNTYWWIWCNKEKVNSIGAHRLLCNKEKVNSIGAHRLLLLSFPECNKIKNNVQNDLI